MFLTETFFIFFILILLLHFAVPTKFRWIILLIASYLFYAYIDPGFPVYLIALTILSYLITSASERSVKKKKFFFLLGISIPILTLVYFKYLGFFAEVITDILGLSSDASLIRKFNVILPAGISFYIFKMLSYQIDLYNKRIKFEKHPGYYALYLAFFPQLLAGPIERAKNFIPELRKGGLYDKDLFYSGAKLVLWGLIKKTVIADRLSIFVNEVFATPSSFKGVTLVVTAIFFSFQIYCDFSGYSDIAIGLGRMLGYRSKDNFNYPYFSKSVGEFWNNWHISLSSWLRDYLFFPLSFFLIKRLDKLNLSSKNSERITYSISALFTMFIAGLWHGADWTYVLWGVTIGIFLVIAFLTKKIRRRYKKFLLSHSTKIIYNFYRTITTFLLITFAWIFFRASSIKEAFVFIGNISFKYNGKGFGFMLTSGILIILFIISEYMIRNQKNFGWIKRTNPVLRFAGYSILICILIILGVDSKNEFLYFNF